MTQKAAIAMALLNGEVLSIMNGFKLFNCTNLPREISRSIEQEFNVVVSRESVPFKSKYGNHGVYFKYRLNRTDYNTEGIKKMEEYISQFIQPEKAKQPEHNSIF